MRDATEQATMRPPGFFVLVLLLVALVLVGLAPAHAAASTSAYRVTVTPDPVTLHDDEETVILVRVHRDGYPVAGALVQPVPESAARFDARLVLTDDRGHAAFTYRPPTTEEPRVLTEGFAVSTLDHGEAVFFDATVKPASARLPAPVATNPVMSYLAAVTGLAGIALALVLGERRNRPVAGAFSRSGANAMRTGILSASLGAMALLVGIHAGDSLILILAALLLAASAGVFAWSRRQSRDLEARVPGRLDPWTGAIARELGVAVEGRRVGRRYRVLDLAGGSRVRLAVAPRGLRVRIEGRDATALAERLTPVLDSGPRVLAAVMRVP